MANIPIGVAIRAQNYTRKYLQLKIGLTNIIFHYYLFVGNLDAIKIRDMIISFQKMIILDRASYVAYVQHTQKKALVTSTNVDLTYSRRLGHIINPI